MRASVLMTTLRHSGRRMGGSSRMKSDCLPGMTRAASQPTTSIVATTTPPQTIIAQKPIPPTMPSSTPSCAEQGTPNASSSVTWMRSLRLSRMRVAIVAIVSHPRPRIMGSTALPLSPMTRNERSSMTASRGR